MAGNGDCGDDGCDDGDDGCDDGDGMTISVYVDGSGGPRSAYGYFVRETGRTFCKKEPGLTNNQAEYMAVIAALVDFEDHGGDEQEPVVIYSDSKNTVSQLNHEYAINNGRLRELAMQAWEIMGRYKNLEIRWVPRGQNPAGRMMGS